MKKILLFGVILIATNGFSSSPEKLDNKLNEEINGLMKKVISWRHDFHQYPELSNREFRTSKKVAEHL